MRDKIIYEYCVLRYVPDVERGEFLNVGLMMMCKRWKWLRVELLIDEARILALSPCADLPLLRRQLEMFLKKDVPSPGLPVEERYRWFAAVKSAIIQTSPSHPGIILSPNPESSEESIESALEITFADLFSRLVANQLNG